MSTVFGNNPRYRIPTAESIANINYDRVLEIARTLYGNAGAFNFVFVGNYDEAVLRDYIEQYIASLPSTGKNTLKSKELRTYVKGSKKNDFEKMENPQAQANEIWRSNPLKFNLQNRVIISITRPSARHDLQPRNPRASLRRLPCRSRKQVRHGWSQELCSAHKGTAHAQSRQSCRGSSRVPQRYDGNPGKS